MSTSWLPIPPNSDFTLSNIPFGIFSTPSTPPRPATAIGASLIDLYAFTSASGFSALPEFHPYLHVFQDSGSSLNAFAALGQPIHNLVRSYLKEVLTSDGKFAHILQTQPELQKLVIKPLDSVTMCLPLAIGDYSDFYAGRVHAFNVGCLFRGRDNALQKNYEHLPVGYHGRASSVVVSGTEVRRPWGQTAEGVFEKCKKLDLELEIAAFVARGNELGESISTKEAGERIFGFVLMNDWSARDIQSFEYVPLGPFTSKSFATTISPWVVLPSALTPFLTTPLPRISSTPLHPYLTEEAAKTVYDISLTVALNSHPITRTSSKNLLWSFNQMVAHHAVTGCNLRTGDLLGSGTISGEGDGEAGCLLEATQGGKKVVRLGEGVERTWLEDGDEVVITGYCGDGDGRVGWGECRGAVVPAREL
ncbi:Fumarylacetoacetase [Wilcoxina mikolae CBS 423.85]|nr:Fumarylacetoacetase [Wilcoxina mikolae CBS 423.85]